VKPGTIALVWLGVVIGVSFVATPVKFTAPSLDLPTALEVGRVTFRLLARIEWVLAGTLLIAALLRPARLPWSAYVVFAIVALESLWLLPALGARTDVILAGGTAGPSSLHHVFVLAEVLECLALAHVAFAGEPSRRRLPV
jgi:hypothetical protein